MATRLENQRTTKRPQAVFLWDISSEVFVSAIGRPPRLEPKGYPARQGVPKHAYYTVQA